MLTRKMFESRVSESHFRTLERFYRILVVRKRHFNISEALANVFFCTASTWGPPLGPLGLGAPGFSRSEPIVVTPLLEVANPH